MRTRNYLFALLLTLISALAVGSDCSGIRGPGTDNNGTDTNGTDDNLQPGTLAIRIGEIERFGSIYVNGQRIHTGGSEISFDDQPGVEDNLKVGMRVRVEVETHEDGTLHAHRILGDDEVHGVIDGSDLAAFQQKLSTGRMSVMGQDVRVDNMTAFHDCNPGNLQPGQIVQIMGPRDAAGVIHATLVDRKGLSFDDLPAERRDLEVKGTVANLDTAAQTFTIGALTVDFSSAVLEDTLVAAGGLADGRFVEARSNQPLANGVLIAASIHVDDRGLGIGEQARVKGLITSTSSANDFVVDGHAVRTNASTVFKRGTPSDIAVGRLVEVEGAVAVTGVLAAREVSFELASNIKLEAVPLADVDADAQTVTALGVVIKTDASTRMEDDSSAQVRLFNLASLKSGDRLCIRAFLDSSTGQVVASRLEREDARNDGRVLLQGPLDPNASTPETLVILGAQINTATIVKFESLTATHIKDAASFLAAAKDTTGGRKLVKVQGTLQLDGSVRWDRAELELEHEFHNEVENEFEFEFEVEDGFQNQFEHGVGGHD